MIEVVENNVYITCDCCNKKEFIRKKSNFDILKMRVKFPKDWTGYDFLNQTRYTFCPNKLCQKILDHLL